MRDEERRTLQKSAAAMIKEDAMWQDDDKKTLKRLEKQRESEQKAAEKATRDAEKKEQLIQEEHEGKALKPHIQKRMTQKDLAKMLATYDKERDALHGAPLKDNAIIQQSEEPLPNGNMNRARGVQKDEDPNVVKASGSAGDVLAKLKSSAGEGVPDDRHIGRRARVLYKKFYAEQLQTVKVDHPNLRRTQYNDVIWEMWQKSLQNPFVIRGEVRDHARLEEERRWTEGGGDSDEEDRDGERGE